MLKDKQAAANAGANKGKPSGNSYAERQSAAQPAQSVATGRAGNLVGSTTAAAGQAPSIRERRRAKATRNDWASVQNDTATALQRLQNDADYRAELGTPGRKLTQAEINAVNQYGQNAGNLYKQVQNGTLSLDDYNTQAQALSRMNQKASLNGLGQDFCRRRRQVLCAASRCKSKPRKRSQIGQISKRATSTRRPLKAALSRQLYQLSTSIPSKIPLPLWVALWRARWHSTTYSISLWMEPAMQTPHKSGRQALRCSKENPGAEPHCTARIWVKPQGACSQILAQTLCWIPIRA